MRIILTLALLVGLVFPIAHLTFAGQPQSEISTGTVIDFAVLSSLIDRMVETAKQMKDATCIFHKQEYKGELLPKEVIDLKVRTQPASVYMKWQTVHRGREVTWRDGWYNNEICVRWLPWNLPTDSKDAMRDNRHPIYDAGFKHIIDLLARDRDTMNKDRGCFKSAEDLGERSVFGVESRCYAVETDKADCTDLYGYRAQFCFDSSSGLPNEVQVWDLADGIVRLVESYGYEGIRKNVGLTDADFNLGGRCK